ncbi:BA14K family protein [Brevundimonas sp.]|uniref:BA14K family protein n=1 Tax=Brevundimonas sp. TaxID=1871086 RepID=UPI00272F5C0E|nr:BA14K family protein [Brevundimonas sp.]MDP1911901.1 BA14K family protein [Brevundimonas sp.]
MFRLVLIATAGLSLSALPAAAQSWGGTYDNGYGSGDSYRSYDSDYGQRSYGYGSEPSNAVPSNFDWRSQLDRPGDYRCDQFWDANRNDCGARWRDQRHRVSPQARRDYRELAGYGRAYDSYGHGYNRSGHGHGRGYSRRGYGSAYGHAQGSTTYHGAYGRPDHVYPGGGVSYGGYTGGHGGGYNSRADWCRATYRSYDPSSGYYRAYSGRLVYCG